MTRGMSHFLLPLLLIAAAQAQTNRFDTAEGVEEGRALFQIHCTYCHGARGEGGRGADLTTGAYRQGGSDADLFTTIREGIPGTEMPAVRANDTEVWKVVAFVKKLGSAGLSEKATGDPVAGKAIYRGKGGCPACHAINGEGGSLGPELTTVGRSRGLKFLEESLVNPDAEVPTRYRSIRVLTKSGQTIIGPRLNEDDVSIQVRDEKENPRSFLKENIAEIKRDKPSQMPAYGTALSKKELEDLVAYLSSLRGVK
jgi:putative heme-binding domain-containing protein